MRILRGKSSREVSSNGFALFVIGLVLATFIGGAIRTLLSSEQVHQRVVNGMRERFPRHEFQVGQTEVLLSNGMWPGLVLRVKDLVLKQDVCGKVSFKLEVPEATLPVDLWSLNAGPVRLQKVNIRDGHIHLDYRDCTPRLEPGSSLLAAPLKLETPKIEAPSLDWQVLGRHLDGLRFINFLVTYERNVTWKLALHEADFDFGPEMNYWAKIDVQKGLRFGSLTHTVQVKGHGAQRVLDWELHSDFKEGHAEWRGTWDLSTSTAKSRVFVRQIPMKDLMFELHQMGFVDREINLKTAWLTSDIEWSGKVANLADYPLKFNQFSFFGGYGRLELVEPSQMKIKGSENFSEQAVFKANQLQLHPMAEAFNIKILPAVISRLGLWSGLIRIKGPENWKLDGFLENLEIVFSSASVRGKQLVKRIHTVASRMGERTVGQVDEVLVNEGEFFGLIDLNWDHEKKSGEIKAQIERLNVSPTIQNILMGGEISPVRVQAAGHFLDQKIENWALQAEMPQARGKGWRGDGFQFKAKSLGGAVAVELEANELQIEPGSKYVEQLKAILPEFEKGIVWKSGKAQVRVVDNGGEILSVSALQTDSPYQWKGRGSWVRNGDFAAIMSFAGAGSKTRSLSIHGKASDFRIENYTGISR